MRRTLNYLRLRGPRRRPCLKKELKVPTKQDRTFDRGIENLEYLGDVKEKDGNLIPYGHEEPEHLKISIGDQNFMVEVPIKTELAKRALQKNPSVRGKITARRESRDFLKEVGILEEQEKEA